MTTNDQLKSIIERLRIDVPELRGALVATTDGLAVAHSLSSGDANRIAAMVATALGLGKRICDSIGGGDLSETSFTGAAGQVYVYSAGKKGVLGVLAAVGSNVGLIHLEARDAAAQIQTVLG
ncbi:MAG: roadblock/LC7 domain-containing protein [Candidatus Methylacidiphilales bacterium]|nr:roadblock/LC7 domain-containing protein [Candidatus Methylacidiphilales bacterium]